jgi:hypothetical protein
VKRHELDVFSLVSGLVFAAVAAVYLVAAATDSEVQGRWVIPLALIGLGIGGLVGSVVRARRNGRAYDDSDRPGPVVEPLAETPAEARVEARVDAGEPPVGTGETLADTLMTPVDRPAETKVIEPDHTPSDSPGTRGE